MSENEPTPVSDVAADEGFTLVAGPAMDTLPARTTVLDPKIVAALQLLNVTDPASKNTASDNRAYPTPDAAKVAAAPILKTLRALVLEGHRAVVRIRPVDGGFGFAVGTVVRTAREAKAPKAGTPASPKAS